MPATRTRIAATIPTMAGRPSATHKKYTSAASTTATRMPIMEAPWVRFPSSARQRGIAPPSSPLRHAGNQHLTTAQRVAGSADTAGIIGRLVPAAPPPPAHWPEFVSLSRPAPVRREHGDEPERSPSRAQEDRALFERYLDRRDPTDREALVERFLPLARQLARRYQRPEEPFDDLLQVASLGLVKAIDRFDLEREVAFSSYAVPTILGEIKRYFRDRTWSVRVPRDLQELALKVDRAVAQLSLDLRRSPSVAEIARAVESSPEEVLEALEASGAYRATSLESPRGSDDEAGDTLGDTVGTDEQGFARAEDRATLAQLLRAVTPREREVLRLRFEEDLTQAEIGDRIGVSQMQVSRIIRQSLTRLRTVARAGVEDGDR